MLSFLKRWRQRRVEVHHQLDIRFVCEQDGPAERELKAALGNAFTEMGGITRAYLVRVDYGNPDAYEVALCIQAPEETRIVRRVADEFAKLFGADAHLDTLFLTIAKEREVARVATPFFSAT